MDRGNRKRGKLRETESERKKDNTDGAKVLVHMFLSHLNKK